MPSSPCHGTDFKKQGADGTGVELCTNSVGPSVGMGTDLSIGEARSNPTSALPPLCDLDLGVIESLPHELF